MRRSCSRPTLGTQRRGGRDGTPGREIRDRDRRRGAGRALDGLSPSKPRQLFLCPGTQTRGLAHLELPIRTSTAADALTKVGNHFVVTAGGQTFEADNAVVASGVMQKPVVPSFAVQLDPQIRQLHSNDYRNLSQLQEGGVLVVGAS